MHMDEREKQMHDLEQRMAEPGFWDDKEMSQEVVRSYNELKQSAKTNASFPAVITIVAGTGGDDAEDFARILAGMYRRYADRKGFAIYEVEKHETSTGGYKNVTLEITDASSFALLRHETGVHRLVRISPFNARKQRHTSFVLVDVTPRVPSISDVAIPEGDLEITFMHAGGPGGQHVNKRETAVRVRHIPSGLTVRSERHRSQVQNKETALEILRGKLLSIMQKRQVQQLRDLSFDKKVGIEWGNQVRSYVLHPYKMVKDLRVGYEERDPDEVFDGKIDRFIRELQAHLS